MSDSAFVAQKLWSQWVPEGTRRVVEQAVGGNSEMARKLYCFLAGVHDIGKAVPVFQCKQWKAENGQWEDLSFLLDQVGLIYSSGIGEKAKPTHPIAGQVILTQYFIQKCHWSRKQCESYFCVVGGHHGKPPVRGELTIAENSSGSQMGWRPDDGNTWKTAQAELIDFVRGLVNLDDASINFLSRFRLQPLSSMVLTGLVIMADWIASNQEVFPLIPMLGGKQRYIRDGKIDFRALQSRAEDGWLKTGLIPAWHDSVDEDALDCSTQELYERRFSLPKGAEARPMQKEVVDIAKQVSAPGIMVIEAPMGEGKTEAALAVSEVFAEKSGRGGVCVALPTMATTDAMFGRVLEWVNKLPQGNGEESSADGGQSASKQERNQSEKSVYLAHGKAKLNEKFQGLIDESFKQGFSDVGDDVSDDIARGKDGTESALVSEWMMGKKKGVLANFLVCTIDQLLMSALDMKHVALRQLAMVNKVVIVDECHAYDTYMRQYLLRVLQWLGAAGTPVILLSATLPEGQRADMVEAYRQGVGLPKSKQDVKATLPTRKNHKKAVDCEEAKAVSLGQDSQRKEVDTSYPLITYTDGQEIKSVQTAPSGRHTSVDMSLIDDSDEALVKVLKDKLADGGCAGVICDTVGRAQAVKKLLSQHFKGEGEVFLTHSRFMDLDRMSNEQYLREVLGPKVTASNGRRPNRLIVVGTQVLEQSLDIDFDLLVTDIAPVDLLMQRLGRVHRHHRGEGESDRPERLRQAKCYVRGIESWQADCPRFSPGIDRVYSAASLMESLAVSELGKESASACVSLPDDIPALVRTAYSDRVEDYVPSSWTERYQVAQEKRRAENTRKKQRAGSHLLHSLKVLECRGNSLVDLFSALDEVKQSNELVDGSKFHLDDDIGPRAVRDTQESVEVLLLAKNDKGINLLPWIGDESSGIALGTELPTDEMPDDSLSQLVAQCAVRLPWRSVRRLKSIG
ncbi:CRISPR-associated helicase Cas3' [Bifidobacterium sp. ESL0798]|nr:CRISPR-associated helicase Cas3' [Bifidobacterium sp. ESL0798]WEV74910.1 CRISPR-associated helicase Cas3' [Bifidobacterium sp. ESL0798]